MRGSCERYTVIPADIEQSCADNGNAITRIFLFFLADISYMKPRLIIRSTHRRVWYGFEPLTEHMYLTSLVVLAGVPNVFLEALPFSPHLLFGPSYMSCNLERVVKILSDS